MSILPETRKKRHMQKISHGQRRIAHLEVWLGESPLEPDTKTLLAIEKACQEAIEVSTDMLAMMLKDQSIPPGDGYLNVTRALEESIIPDNLADVLREANGLRNRPIHVYNDLDVAVLLESVKRMLPGIAEFFGVVERWLKI